MTCVGTHQVAEVAERVPGQLHDALREPALVADEAGDDGGQSVSGPVQHDGGGGSPHSDFGAAAPWQPTEEIVFFLTFGIFKSIERHHTAASSQVSFYYWFYYNYFLTYLGNVKPVCHATYMDPNNPQSKVFLHKKEYYVVAKDMWSRLKN